MSVIPPKVLASHTVQLYSKNGLAKVVGVVDEDIKKVLLDYIDEKDGWERNNWFYFVEDKFLLDVVDKAKELDPEAKAYKVEVGWVYIHVNCAVQPVDSESDLTFREKFDLLSGKFTVLYKILDKTYKLCLMKAEYQKIELDHYIMEPPIDAIREGDWYRLDNNDKIGLVDFLVNTPKVHGVIYNMVNEATNKEDIWPSYPLAIVFTLVLVS